MKDWHTIPDLIEAKLPDLPTSVRRLHDHALRAGWTLNPATCRKVEKRGGGMEYHVSLLPPSARAKLAYLQAPTIVDTLDRSKMLWNRFELLTDEHKLIAKERLAVLEEAEDMRNSGMKAAEVVRYCTLKAGISRATFYEWRQLLEGWPRADWLAALAPSFSATADGVIAKQSECHPKAWEYLKSDYLRPEEPKFSACYRRMIKLAKRDGWLPVPSERTLRRRIEQEVGKAVMTLARKGKDKARALHPAQRGPARIYMPCKW